MNICIFSYLKIYSLALLYLTYRVKTYFARSHFNYLYDNFLALREFGYE